MKRAVLRAITPVVVGIALTMPAPRAQSPPVAQRDAPAPNELREAMREFFANRLRSELALSDEQVEQVIPQLQRFESEGRQLRQSKATTLRELQRGMEHGASDVQLQALLDTLDGADASQLDLKRSVLSEVDRSLSVRQRVRLRFFMERFPRMVREQIESIRGGRRPMGSARPPFRRAPGGDR